MHTHTRMYAHTHINMDKYINTHTHTHLHMPDVLVAGREHAQYIDQLSHICVYIEVHVRTYDTHVHVHVPTDLMYSSLDVKHTIS